ncbi:CCA tRNA nucleotidyltransferase [Desulfolucanica intricata]|uniref:CCA tRNA nucleotidyltransferase n=1 Tax=Desulfolucanica intricata TaxID=1285191 RepID=UPI0008304BC1|nr:CCA tRNA nucleotidyltransferase [Desulfolucanica intricata]
MLKQILTDINNLAGQEGLRVYAVGGCIRDLLLGLEPIDIDLAVPGAGIFSFAKKLAAYTGAAFVPLDPINKVARVIISRGGEKLQLDIAAFKGLGIIEDLCNRDFTINALAVPLEAYLSGKIEESTIDPTGGLNDLRKGKIRATGAAAFTSDPVRVLRAFRLSAKLNFSITKDTLTLMKVARGALSASSPERVLEELLQILELPGSFTQVKLMDRELLLFDEIFPRVKQMRVMKQNNHHTENVWVHSLSTLHQLESDILPSIPDKLAKAVIPYLNEVVAAGRSRLPSLKLACLLHDAGKIDTCKVQLDGKITFHGHERAGIKYVSEFSSGLRLGAKERAILEMLVKRHMHPLQLYTNRGNISRAAIYRFFRAAGREAPGCLLLSMADLAASRRSTGRTGEIQEYKAFIYSLMEKYFFAEREFVSPPKLVTGKDLISKFGLRPSKQIGDILDKISEAQVEGAVAGRQDAMRLAAKILGTELKLEPE